MSRLHLLIVRVATAFAVWGSAVACHDANAPTGAPGSMVVIRKDAPTDTVLGAPAILVLRIYDEAGRPAARTVVDFRGAVLPHAGSLQVALYIAPDTSRRTEQLGQTRSVMTDGNGRVAVAVSRRVIAGPLAVGVSSAAIPQLRDSVIFVTTPGGLADVIVSPADSATTVGGSYAVSGVPVDRWGNVRADPVTFAIGVERAFGPGASPSAHVAVLEGRTLRGLQTGRVRIDASAGSKTGSGWASIVPMARLAAIDPILAAGETPALVLVNTDGTAIRSFALNRYTQGHPRWVPGRGRVVLESVPVNGQDPSVSPRLAFVDTASGVRTEVVGQIAGIEGQYRPAVGAMGQEIYFAGVTSVPQMQAGVCIYRVDADGSNLVRIGPPVDPYTSFGEPDVSPDGSTLVVRRNGVLMLMDAATGSLTRLSQIGEAYDARWSPDGRRIAFRAGASYWSIDADGSNEHALTGPAVEGDFFPGHSALDWSPDGAWLVIRANGQLQLLDPASGETLPLPATRRFVAGTWAR